MILIKQPCRNTVADERVSFENEIRNPKIPLSRGRPTQKRNKSADEIPNEEKVEMKQNYNYSELIELCRSNW